MSTLMQPTFAAGELSPELRRRIDLQKYSAGAEIIKNMVVLPRGGVQSRTGLRMVATVKSSDKKPRLVDFVFSVTQAYVLEFGDLYIRVFKDRGAVLSGESIYEIITPYAEADLVDLKFEQSADTLYICHPDHAPKTLTRSGHTNWTLADFSFKNGPYLPENTTDTTMTISAAGTPAFLWEGDTVTLTASANTFVDGHVGAVFGIRHTQHAKSYYRSVASGGGVYVSDNFPVWGEWELTIQPGSAGIDNTAILLFKSVDGGTTWYQIHSVPATTSSATVIVSGSADAPALLQLQRDDVADSFNYTLNSYGHAQWACVKLTGVATAVSATGTLLTDFDQVGVAFKSWAEGVWSDVRGWPTAVSFYQDRLCFGGNAASPNGFWDSKTGDYVNFGLSLPSLDDDAIESKLLGRTVNSIQWMIPLQAHIVLTTDSEWTIEPQIAGQFSAGTMQIKQQTYFGCEGIVEPAIVGDMAIFLQRTGKAVRGMAYDDIKGKQVQDLSIMAAHLFKDASVVDWAYQQYPNSVLWCVMSDGTALSFTFHREHEVWAWARHETLGLFESVAAIPGDGQDDVYFIVNRTINGTATRFVEVMETRDTSDYFGVDCGITYEGASTATITGLTYLEGATVEVWANGQSYGQRAVASGAITLPVAVTKANIGLPFEYQLRTLQIDVTSKNTGYGSDKKKLIQGVTISVENSMGGRAGLDDQYTMLNYPRNGLYSGDIDQKLNSSWSKDGQIEIVGSGVLPMHIINIMPQVTVGGI